MDKQRIKILPIIFAAINLLIGAIIIWSLVMIVIYIIRFYNEAHGLLYAKEFKQYLENIRTNLAGQNWTQDELKHFAKVFNDNYGETRLVIPQGADIKANVTAMINQLEPLLKNADTRNQTITSLLHTANDSSVHFLDFSMNPHIKEFIQSAINFTKHLDIKLIVDDVNHDQVNKSRILNYILYGMGSWFNDVNTHAFVVVFVFFLSWGLAFAFAIFNKIVRYFSNLKAGTGLIIWSLLIPFFGFIVYPLLSFGYLFKNKQKKTL